MIPELSTRLEWDLGMILHERLVCPTSDFRRLPTWMKLQCIRVLQYIVSVLPILQYVYCCSEKQWQIHPDTELPQILTFHSNSHSLITELDPEVETEENFFPVNFIQVLHMWFRSDCLRQQLTAWEVSCNYGTKIRSCHISRKSWALKYLMFNWFNRLFMGSNLLHGTFLVITGLRSEAATFCTGPEPDVQLQLDICGNILLCWSLKITFVWCPCVHKGKQTRTFDVQLQNFVELC